jgi:hypothetical protein
LGDKLAQELASDFVKIRADYSTKTMERASPGKFVETFVQCLQFLQHGTYDTKPDVDDFLNKKAEHCAKLSDGLRICGARIARSIYTLRNKRNIAHKGEVDPNSFDLAFCHQGAAWIVAELLRTASGITMEEAGALIDLIHTPVGTLVEEIDGVRLVHGDLKIRSELLILLHSYYPDVVKVEALIKSLSPRKPTSVRNELRAMATQKLVFGTAAAGFRLTSPGFDAAAEVRRKL